MKRLLAVLLLLTGCARQPAARQAMTPEAAFTPTPQTAVPLSATAFQSATLPDHVFDLYGTALYKDSLQVNEWLPAPRPEPAGVFFLLVSSNNPELGVLVYGGPASSYNHLKRQPAGPRKLTGDVKEFDAEELAKKVKERYGVTLCSRSLKLQYVVPKEPVFARPLPEE